MLFKPRNPMGILVHKRKAGKHDKSERVKRREAKESLNKEIKKLFKDESIV